MSRMGRLQISKSFLETILQLGPKFGKNQFPTHPEYLNWIREGTVAAWHSSFAGMHQQGSRRVIIAKTTGVCWEKEWGLRIETSVPNTDLWLEGHLADQPQWHLLQANPASCRLCQVAFFPNDFSELQEYDLPQLDFRVGCGVVLQAEDQSWDVVTRVAGVDCLDGKVTVWGEIPNLSFYFEETGNGRIWFLQTKANGQPIPCRVEFLWSDTWHLLKHADGITFSPH